MAELVQLGGSTASCEASPRQPVLSPRTLWLQTITVAWMLVECGVSAFAAWTAHSAAILAFGADSLVEVLSATVVLAQFAPRFGLPRLTLPERIAGRLGAVLLWVLALLVAGAAIASLLLGVHPQVSRAGIAVTAAALIAMPVLAALKRREARRSGNAALAADAVQSATCAYLAAIALVGLACNAAFHLAWIDSAAALAAIPILLQEGRRAWRGQACGCC